MGTYTITTTDEQDKCLKYMIPDVQKWLQSAIDGKINNTKKVLIKDWQQKLFDDPAVTTMPATETDFINTVTARGDYKDRSTRDAEG